MTFDPCFVEGIIYSDYTCFNNRLSKYGRKQLNVYHAICNLIIEFPISISDSACPTTTTSDASRSGVKAAASRTSCPECWTRTPIRGRGPTVRGTSSPSTWSEYLLSFYDRFLAEVHQISLFLNFNEDLLRPL